MLKIVLINHSFQIKYYSRRWQLFANDYPDVDIYLLAPSKYKWYNNKRYTYSGAQEMEAENYDSYNFHLRVFKLKYKHSWISDDFTPILRSINPDVIYHIGLHTQLSLVQLGEIRKKYLPNCKLVLFSMRGPAHDIHIPKYEGSLFQWISDTYLNIYRIPVVNYVNKHYDAVFCHYPEAVESFKKEGYKGPIYMQTQVGVNTEWFHPDKNARQEIRNKYQLDDSFVFGSATRFTIDKGVDDILEALPTEGNYKYLMMGTGSDNDIARLKNIINRRGINDKVIITGFVDWYEMAKYWNAVDCAIHVPRTTPHWTETFSLSVVQAMATAKAIIGNTSGSVPYQIGKSGILVQEGNLNELRKSISWILNNQDKAKQIGLMMRERANSCFSVSHLNELFYKTIIEDVLRGSFDVNKIDMTAI